MTKTAETMPFGAAHTHIAHIREYPSPRADSSSIEIHDCLISVQAW